MRSVLVAFCIMGLITEVAQASSIMTIEAPAQAISPSIIEVVAATPTSPASDEISLSPQGSLQLTQLDPLNMLPAGGSSVVRMEPITPSVIAVIAPTPDVSTEMVAAIEHRKPRVNDMPMVMRGGILPVLMPGTTVPEDARAASVRFVTPDYFAAMRIPVLRGRAVVDQLHEVLVARDNHDPVVGRLFTPGACERTDQIIGLDPILLKHWDGVSVDDFAKPLDSLLQIRRRHRLKGDAGLFGQQKCSDNQSGNRQGFAAGASAKIIPIQLNRHRQTRLRMVSGPKKQLMPV